MIAQIPDYPAAHLETFFYGNANPLHRGPGFLYDGNQPLQCASVGQEIIDDSNMLSF